MSLLEDIGEHLSGIEQLRVMLQEGRRPGIAETLDIRLTEIDDGRVCFEALPDVHVYNPIGSVHGGFIATMLDFACGYAVLSKLEPGQYCTTLDLRVSYHKSITRKTGSLRAEGKILSVGRRVAFSEGKLYDADGRLYASGSSSLMILARKQA